MALVVVIVVLALLWRRSAFRAREERRVAAIEQDAQRADLIAAHDAATARARAVSARAVADEQEQRRRAEQAAEATREQLRKGMQWEEASQQTLTDLCRELHVDGALVTNVVFVPVETTQERKFVAQVDHVLLLESGALIVEAKNWKGLVFDGVIPSRAHPSFAGLINETHLEAPFAIQITNDTIVPKDGATKVWWKVRIDAGTSAPAKQARTQGARLAAFTKQQLGFAPWFGTCVYYSHPDAATHVAAYDRTERDTVTAIVTTREALRAVIRDGAGKPPTAITPHRLEQLIGLFSTQGAHVERFGSYRNHTPA